ncbi:MAG: TetR/AcrR family transcriptional regulator [Acidimicrobiia bacterium]
MSGTRERILAVATELFIDQGYEATSLRQIADRLGITKAALYYHFQSKEQIFTALLEPVSPVLAGFIDQMVAAEGLEGWAEALDWVLVQMLEHFDLFKLTLRNRQAMAELQSAIEHSGKNEKIRAAIRDKAADVPQQIRMIAALGAISAFDDWAPDLLTDEPEVVVAELRAATRDILGLPKLRRPRPNLVEVPRDGLGTS